MADFLKDQIAAIDNRLKELRPLHDEYLQLQKAREALAGVGTGGTARRGRPRGSGTGTTRRRRRRRGGTRAEEALALLRQNPGMTVRELSEKMNIKHPNYLYRVLGGLESEGAVKKKGKGWSAV
jgi:hypothetical protein